MGPDNQNNQQTAAPTDQPAQDQQPAAAPAPTTPAPAPTDSMPAATDPAPAADPMPSAQPAKKSKMGLIIGVAVVVVVLAVAAYFLV